MVAVVEVALAVGRFGGVEVKAAAFERIGILQVHAHAFTRTCPEVA